MPDKNKGGNGKGDGKGNNGKGKDNGGGGNDLGLSRKELAANYGWALATLRSDPELWDLFDSAVKHTWSAAKFIAMLRDTKWFKSKSEPARKYVVLKTSDPAQFDAVVDERKAHIGNLYGQLVGGELGEKRLNRMAHTALRLGWTDEQLADRILDSVNWKNKLRKSELSGNAQQLRDQLHTYARLNGVKVGREWMSNQLNRVLSGNDTAESSMSRITEMAQKRYGAYADELGQGQTLTDLTESYRQSMAQTLELNPGQIDVFNKHIQKAITHTNDDGKQQPLNLHAFEDRLRKDKRWQYTDNAHAMGDQMTSQLLQDFGLLA